MAKAFKFKNNNFLDSSGIMHNRQSLKDILGCRVRYSGTRNKYYLIGTGKLNNAYGQLTFFCSNADDYTNSAPAFFSVDATGKSYCKLVIDKGNSSYRKKLYVYKDNTNYYIVLESPNYSDEWFIDILVATRIDVSFIEMTPDEFNSFKSNKTLISNT